MAYSKEDNTTIVTVDLNKELLAQLDKKAEVIASEEEPVDKVHLWIDLKV